MSLQLERHHRANRPALGIGDERSLAARGALPQTLARVVARIAPLWPLAEYVAVNPFWGWADTPFLLARQLLVAVRDCELLPPREYFQQLWENREVAPLDLSCALEAAAAEYPAWYAGWDFATVLAAVDSPESAPAPRERRYFALSEVVDQRTGSHWTSHIINDITRTCAAHADEGQAAWPSPWRDETLYRAWLQMARRSHRMDWLGLVGFRNLVSNLPNDEQAAIAWCLRTLQIPPSQQEPYLLCLLYSIAGWGGYWQYQEAWRVDRRGAAPDPEQGVPGGDLTGLLAIRLTYEVALAAKFREQWSNLARECVPAAGVRAVDEPWWVPPRREVLARYVWQLAAESAYRRRLLGSLAVTGSRTENTAAESPRRSAQIVFCIDVRSEVMRRHLEAVAPSVETWGFAGFFGMALQQSVAAADTGEMLQVQCPVLLQPGMAVHEPPCKSAHAATPQGESHRARRQAEIWKSFQSSASSCFSFVETWGLTYLGKLWGRSLRPWWAARAQRRTPTAESPLELRSVDDGRSGARLDLARQLELAEGLLRNLGLGHNLARLIVFCGHTAHVENNPYQAALDCGACGGHSGETNARVAAQLLNDPVVRRGLATRGIAIPEDTWFLAAVHNTTTDTIRFCDAGQLPATHGEDLQQFTAQVAAAAECCRRERGQRMEGADAADLWRRSRDWSEVRPEWGLAGNACFVAAPRTWTAGVDLGGRSFLHSYEAAQDPEGEVLALILTAPLIVANWINLQYYASTIDNRAFGSGSKTLHNLVGRFGVLAGNGGDLTTGLPWQSVHDGRTWQHPPQRLLAVVAAARNSVDRVVQQHSRLRELLAGGWLALVVWEEGRAYRWSSGGWQGESVPCPARCPSDGRAAGGAAP